jgi:hypothetical protein
LENAVTDKDFFGLRPAKSPRKKRSRKIDSHEAGQQVFVMNWDGNAKIAEGCVEQARMAASVMVDVKAGGRYDLLGFLGRKPGRRHRGETSDRNFNPLGLHFGHVARDVLAGLKGALQKAADGIPRHGAGFLHGFAYVQISEIAGTNTLKPPQAVARIVV